MDRNDLNSIAREIHAQAAEKGFWDVEDAMVKHIAKMHSELSEALQEDRMGHPMLYVDDIETLERIADPELFDGRKPEGIAAELADFVMMALDLMEQLFFDAGELWETYKDEIHESMRTMCSGMQLYSLVCGEHGSLCTAIKCYRDIDGIGFIHMILTIELWLEQHGVDIWQVIRLKLEYNKNRPALHGRKY